MPKIVRLTLMKITDTETIQQAIQKYSTLTQDAKKVCTCSSPHFPFPSHAYPFATRIPFGLSACYLHVAHLVTTTPIDAHESQAMASTLH